VYLARHRRLRHASGIQSGRIPYVTSTLSFLHICFIKSVYGLPVHLIARQWSVS
jgi:hypothetical protein